MQTPLFKHKIYVSIHLQKIISFARGKTKIILEECARRKTGRRQENQKKKEKVSEKK